MMVTSLAPATLVSSAALAERLAAVDFSDRAATVVGYGAMGRQYVAALQILGLRRIRVCSRSAEPLAALRGFDGVETTAGGFERWRYRASPQELAILATPMKSLVDATDWAVASGFTRVLVEKPVSLYAQTIERLADRMARAGVEVVCAYNRVAYPSFHEVRTQLAHEGGATSCVYTFTELIKPEWTQKFSAEALARWGVANSLHVMSMAHGLIGWPSTWSSHRSGALPWHPSGAVFVGSGISQRSIPFAYQADWGSTGRWSVEIHSGSSSYRLCPLERVFRRTSATGEWEEIPVRVYAPAVKAGLTELTAAMLHDELREALPLVSLREAAALTRYGERVFGYDAGEPER